MDNNFNELEENFNKTEKEEFEQELINKQLELEEKSVTDKKNISTMYERNSKKFQNSLFVSLVILLVIMVGGWFFTRITYKDTTSDNDVIISNVLEIAVKECYKDTKTYPIDVNRIINVKFLQKQGYLNTNVEDITDTEFILTEDLVVIPLKTKIEK